ncbi:MAG: T9SS type A sorting domain-containing protein [Bacteroidota bacterium]|nr:T9SS type A sorting domain-containing protein [Bacteroidota bacterium]MDP4233854.1 T9SS type A sorting domain-containing protein [Bacteroidota bacterium]MDP4243527.1 T9SS type A sorting domain-containing protein [Bacteroidota bacterium]MDP4289354.1 T9SS type A sorting domain-containing protein [Bacteroidota bacterium]
MDKNFFVGGSGLFESTNEGDRWVEIGLGLPSSEILAIGTDYEHVYVSVGRGSVWRRQLSDWDNLYVSRKSETARSIHCYPNPFSQSTTISFMPESSGYADVSVVNLLGVEVARIFLGELGAGEHSFVWNPADVPNGMYECVVRMNGRIEKRPIMLIR